MSENKTVTEPTRAERADLALELMELRGLALSIEHIAIRLIENRADVADRRRLALALSFAKTALRELDHAQRWRDREGLSPALLA